MTNHSFIASVLALAVSGGAFAMTKPAFDTGSTGFYYNRLQAGYGWTTFAAPEAGVAAPSAASGFLVNGRVFVFEDGVYLKGGFKTSSQQQLAEPLTEQKGNSFTLGAGLRLPIAMDIDFRAEFDYSSGVSNTFNGIQSTTVTPRVGFPGMEGGLVMTTDAGLFASAALRVELPEGGTQTSLHSEVGFNATPNVNISGVMSAPFSFESTSFGAQLGFSF